MNVQSKPFRIDAHHHVFPPRYLERERERVRALTHAFFERVSRWTASDSIAAMDESMTATSLLSMSTPGLWFGDAAVARDHAREFNDHVSELKSLHPGRFGLLAALPLPDVEASLREIERAFDVLKADGIGLMTNSADIWPGDPALSQVFDELNRRKAVVFFHPNATSFSDKVLPGIPAAAIEFPFDTMRAITSLLFSGTFARCPDIRFVFSHGGGVLPMLAGRLDGLAQTPKFAGLLPHGVAHELRKQYYDTAGIVNDVAFNAIRQLVGPSQLLFGSDVPFWDAKKLAAGLDDLVTDEAERAALYRGNAQALFPQLRS